MSTVVGAFDTFAQARNAMDALNRAGFPERDLSIVANNENRSVPTSVGDHRDTTDTDRPSVGGETLTGAVVGALTGVAVGLAALVIPGLGAIAAAGWLGLTLTGAAVGAGVGLVGSLVGAGIPEEHAHVYNEAVRRGGTLVLVRTEDNRAEEAAHILDDAGAFDIDERAAQYRTEGFAPAPTTDYATTTPNYGATALGTAASPAFDRTQATAQTPVMPTMATPNPLPTQNTTRATGEAETTIPVIEENLQVGKREVQRGGVRIYSAVTERPVHESVDLREEHVNVERRPVDRPVGSGDLGDMRNRTIEVRETAEVPVVRKEARVVEEVLVSKDVTQRTEDVADTVRRTDVRVEELPGETRTADTRNPLEKAQDFVTGDTTDDKTGRAVSGDDRNMGEKAADSISGNRR